MYKYKYILQSEEATSWEDMGTPIGEINAVFKDVHCLDPRHNLRCLDDITNATLITLALEP